MQDRRISKNFLLSEYNPNWTYKYVEPDQILGSLLQTLRDRVGPVTITSGPRTFKQHLALYNNNDISKVTYNSRHLPKFGNIMLRAADISVKHHDGRYDEIKTQLLDIRDKIYPSCFLGIGVANNFLHLDVDRERDTFWTYS